MQRKLFWRRDERGVSDIVGTAILLGVTVVIVAAAGTALYSSIPTKGNPPTLNLKAASASPSQLLLTSAGGTDVHLDDLQAVVSTASWSERHNLTGTGEWTLGSSTPVTLTGHTLNPGDHVQVDIVSKSKSAVITTSTFDVPTGASAAAAPSGFTISITTPAGGIGGLESQGSTLWVTAAVAHPSGRTAVLSAYLDASGILGSANEPLYDDGTHGDVVAGDMVYSTYLLIPPAAPAGLATINAYAVDVSGAKVTAGTPLSFTLPTPGSGSSPGGGGNTFNCTGSGSCNTGPGGATNCTGTSSCSNANPTFNCAGATSCTVGPSSATNCTGAGSCANTGPINCVAATSCSIDCASGPCNIVAGGVPAPTITAIDVGGGLSGNAASLGNVSGTFLNFSTSLSMVNTTSGASFGMAAWWVLDSGHLQFFPSDQAPNGLYYVRAVSPGGSATSSQWFNYTAGLGSIPTSVTISPGQATVGNTVDVIGDNLDSVTRLTLNDASRSVVLDVTWWQEGAKLRFTVPPSAAALGLATYPNYTVTLTGQFTGQVAASPQLMILPVPAPTITSFWPPAGTPFTEVMVNGTNFVNVQNVTMNGTNVYFTVNSPTQLTAVTHNGINPGYYSIRVATATGAIQTGSGVATASGSNGLFHALHAPIIPVYPPNIFNYFAVWSQHNTTCSPGDCANIYVKFQLVNSVQIDGVSNLKLVPATSSCSGTGVDPSTSACGFFTYHPFKPGNIPPVGFATQVCNVGNTYVYQFNGSLPNYVSSTYTLAFYNTFTFSTTGSAKGTAADPLHTASIITNDASQYFNLAPTDSELVVYDHSQPVNNNFQNCG